jgi:hypothetical protein
MTVGSHLERERFLTMEEPRIADIPSIKKTREELRNLAQVKKAMPFLRPLLRLLGVDVAGIDESLSQMDDLMREGNEMARILDGFNDLFAGRGWIMYDLMNFEVAKAAVAKGEAGDLDGAEADLVNYYDVETVRSGLRTMHSVRAFRPRMALAEKAVEDYAAERFHACVPVVLALLDGMVNDVYQKAYDGKRRGVSAEDVDLTAWDSIAAHSKGLNRLLKILQTGRRRTTNEQIFLPYRHGILHGVDLGYDNRIVAAKTWAALFATRDWAVRAEQGKLQGPAPTPPPTLKETFRDLGVSLKRWSELQAAQKRMEEWKPRTVIVGRDLPDTGAPNAFGEDTPERKLAEYLELWKRKNYGQMAGCISPFLGPPPNRAAAEVRAAFGTKRLLSFRFSNLTDIAPAITEIDTDLVYEEHSREITKKHQFRMLRAGSDEIPVLDGEDATWMVVTWGVW